MSCVAKDRLARALQVLCLKFHCFRGSIESRRTGNAVAQQDGLRLARNVIALFPAVPLSEGIETTYASSGIHTSMPPRPVQASNSGV